MNQQPIFLIGLHKSGTSLLRSIFDGHPEIFSIPIETHYFQHAQHWVDNEYRKQYPTDLDSNQIKNNLVDWIDFYNNLLNPYADSVVTGKFDLTAFKSKISSIVKISDDKLRLETYFKSIYYSLYKKSLKNSLRVIEKSVENAEFAIELHRMFPSAYFIHIIRNPYSNIVALRKYKGISSGYPVISRLLRTMYNNFYFLYKNLKLIKNYYVIKYEDLVTQPEHNIRNLCHFIELNFNHILLKPTLLGEMWGGNSTTGRVYNSISATNLGKWKKEIHPMEIYYINSQFSFVLQDYSYPQIPMKGCYWKPAKSETLKKYLANRFYKYYLNI